MEETYQLPTDIACPRCHDKLVEATSVTQNASKQLKKGNLMVCSTCGAMLILGDSNFQMLTKEQFDALHPNSKTILAAAKAKVMHMIAEQN